jgi:drug/metabolite transporter (DMT)-like permease
MADNITNKKALKLLGGAKGGLVWCVACMQLFTGVLWVLPLWLLGIRKAPNMTSDNWKAMAPVGLWSAGAHGGSVIALGAGAVSFGQILKACEPVFSAITEVVLTGNVQAWQVPCPSRAYQAPVFLKSLADSLGSCLDEGPARTLCG